MRTIAEESWYETVPFASGVTLIHEPWIKPFFRCNMWHVQGRDRDLLVDTGLGHFSLRKNVPLLGARPLVCVASGVSEATPADVFPPSTSMVSRTVEPSCAAAGAAAGSSARAVQARSGAREYQLVMSNQSPAQGARKPPAPEGQPVVRDLLDLVRIAAGGASRHVSAV